MTPTTSILIGGAVRSMLLRGLQNLPKTCSANTKGAVLSSLEDMCFSSPCLDTGRSRRAGRLIIAGEFSEGEPLRLALARNLGLGGIPLREGSGV